MPINPAVFALPRLFCASPSGLAALPNGLAASARWLRLSGICALLSACLPADGTQAGPSPQQTDPQQTSPLDQPISQPPGQRPRSAAFDQALIADSNAALILFLIHHRDDPALASVREVLANRRQPDSRASLLATAGPEAEVVGAFDAARLAGTAAAWQGFLARYPDHILASEVGYFSQR